MNCDSLGDDRLAILVYLEVLLVDCLSTIANLPSGT